MANENELLIKISGDVKNFEDAIGKVEAKTESLRNKLGDIQKYSGLAFGAITGTIGLLVKAYTDSEKVQVRTSNILKQTGRDAEITTAKLNVMAESLSKATAVDDEEIVRAIGTFAKFDQIATGSLENVTMAALDLAKANNIDLASAAVLLGKALQDPEQGVTALGRAQVKLNKETEETAKAMAKAGDIAGAQRVILDALNGSIGNTAVEMAKATGAFDSFQIAVGNLAEDFGKELKPTTDSLFVSMTGLVEAIRGLSPEAKKLSSDLLIMAGIFTGLAGTTATLVLGWMKLTTVLGALSTAAGATLATVGAVAGAIGLIGTATYLVYRNWDEIWKAMQITVQAFYDFMTPLIDSLKLMWDSVFDVDFEGLKVGFSNLFKSIKDAFSPIDFLLKAFVKDAAKNVIAQQGKATATQKEQVSAPSRPRVLLPKVETDEQKKAREDAWAKERQRINDINSLKREEFEQEIKWAEEKERMFEQLKSAEKEAIQGFSIGMQAGLSALISPKKFVSKEAKEVGMGKEVSKNVMVGGGLSLVGQMLQGQGGAQALIKDIAGTILPGLGQAIGPILDALMQGPDAVRDMMKQFFESIPILIQNIIDSIPVLVEEFAERLPVLVTKLAEVFSNPLLGIKLISSITAQIPTLIQGIIKEMPNIVAALVSGLRDGVKDIFSFVGGGGDNGLLGLGFLGLAEGGQVIKKVPKGYPSDNFPAMLTTDEMVVDRKTTNAMNDFFTNGGLEKALSSVSGNGSDRNITVNLRVGESELANVILNLNRRGYRMA